MGQAGSKSHSFYDLYGQSSGISRGQWKRLLLEHSLFLIGAFCHADDLTILAPSPDVLREMIAECESFAECHGLQFNATKTQLICFLSLSPAQA